MEARWLAVGGGNACGADLQIGSIPYHVTEEAFRHGASANIASADKKYVFHVGHKISISAKFIHKQKSSSQRCRKKIQGLRLKRAGFTVRSLQSHILPTEDLACIHRFAVLLTGSPAPAQAVLLETFAEAGEKIHHFRSGKSCKAWLAAKVRSRVMKPAGARKSAEN